MPIMTSEREEEMTSVCVDTTHPVHHHRQVKEDREGEPSSTDNDDVNRELKKVIPLTNCSKSSSKGIEDEDGLCQRSPKDLSVNHHSHDSASICAGCGSLIQDRYYLLALDLRWHSSCLKCSQCMSSLDTQVSCFTRDGKIYCKPDYYKMFVKRCTRCGQGIFSTDLVMRAKENIYHLSCFTCAWCNVTLSRGETFGICGNLVYCRLHYELRRSAAMGNEHSNISPPLPPPPNGFLPLPLESAIHPNNLIPLPDGHSLSPSMYDPFLVHGLPPGHLHHHHPHHLQHHQFHNLGSSIPGAKGAGGTVEGHHQLNNSLRSNSNVSNGTVAGGVKTGRKGRPRKRKLVQSNDVGNNGPLDSADGKTGTGSNNNNENNINANQSILGNNITRSSSPNGNGLLSSLDSNFDHHTNIPDHSSLLDGNSNGGTSCPGSQSGGSSSRTKRMRTSFKHHQLRTMKQYFAINQNPDAKDLKQLSQKTSLSKRVLQVWFQNARAKWRRNNLKGLQDPNSCTGGSGHLPSMSSSSLNHLSNESNSQSSSGPPATVTNNNLLPHLIHEPGSVGQISSSISILNPNETTTNSPTASTGLASPEDGGGSSSYGGQYSVSPSPSLTGSTGTSSFLPNEMTGGHGHGHHQHHPGSVGSGSLDNFHGYRSSPGGNGGTDQSPTPMIHPVTSTPPISSNSSMSTPPPFSHLSMVQQFHSHLRGPLQMFPGIQQRPRSPDGGQGTRFQELF